MIRPITADNRQLISIVSPAFNEAKGIEKFLEAVEAELHKLEYEFEIIIVDDGSTDKTYETLQKLSNKYRELKAIRLSRNFGKEAALLTGLKVSLGDAVITMDSDLQHPPALIASLIKKWQQGYTIVHAVKEERNCDNIVIKWRANLFNAVFKAVSGINLKNSSDFILMDRIAKDIIVDSMPERSRFFRGLAHWIGFKQTIVYFKVIQRWDKGQSKWSLKSLYNLATTALVSFTSIPLRIITILGLVTLAIGLVIGTDALISWFIGRSFSGFATIIGTLLIIGSFIMISLGILGEYIAKIYEEIKVRPVSLIESSFGFQQDNSHGWSNLQKWSA